MGLSRHTGHEGLKQVHGHRYFVRSSRNALRLLVAVVPTHFLWAHPASPKRSASGSLGVTATIQPSVELTVRTAAGRVLTATGNLEASVILTLGAERQVTTAGRDPIRFTTRLRTANVGPAEGYQLGAILLAKDNQVVEVDGVSLHGGMQANITSGGIAAFNREILHSARIVSSSSADSAAGPPSLVLTARVVGPQVSCNQSRPASPSRGRDDNR